MWDLKHKILAGSLAAATILIGIAFRSWIAEHDARLKAETFSRVDEKVAETSASEIKALQDQITARDVQTAATLESMKQLVSKVQTPQQISTWIPQQLPTPTPITVNVPPSTAANPMPNAIASIPQEDLPSIRDAIAGCQECKVRLSAAQADSAAKDQQLKQAGAALSAKQDEVDNWKKAARGTFWSRTKSALKYIVAGGVIGVAVTCGSGHCK